MAVGRGVTHLAVFLAVAMSDALWALWMAAVAAHRPALAGLASVGLVLAGAFVTVAYVRDRRYLVAAALGAFAGTYLAVARG